MRKTDADRAASLPLSSANMCQRTHDEVCFQGATVAHDLRELCKYTAKISEIVEWPLLVRAHIDYARRRRLIVMLGSCYGAAAEAVLAAAAAEQPTQERTDVEQQPCPACGAVGTLRHDPSRRWRMDGVIAIGGGWYVLGRTPEEHRRVRRDRARASPDGIASVVIGSIQW